MAYRMILPTDILLNLYLYIIKRVFTKNYLVSITSMFIKYFNSDYLLKLYKINIF